MNYSVSFSSDNQRIVSDSTDNTIKIWDAHDGKLIQTIDGHTDSVFSVAFSHQNNNLRKKLINYVNE